MIPKYLDDISEADLQSLIENAVAERKTLEYKRDLPGNADTETKEFLADVSSFANTAGGDLIFGIEAPSRTGEPTEISGLPAEDIESQKLRLEGKVQTGINPRLPGYEVRSISLRSGRVALVIRVPQSWSAPHRVIVKGHGHFYGRNSSGKYQLDVPELRRAFNLSESTAEQIRAFRAERIIAIKRGVLPVPVGGGPRLLIHAVPLSAFSISRPDLSDALRAAFSVNDPYGLRCFKPFSTTFQWDSQVNLDGRVVFPTNAGGRPAERSYVQLFRSGVLESLWELPVGTFDTDINEKHKVIICDRWIPRLWELAAKYLAGLSRLGVEPPIFLFLSVLSGEGYYLAAQRWSEAPRPLDRPEINLPEVLLDSSTADLRPRLRTLLDILWNACGAEQNPYIE